MKSPENINLPYFAYGIFKPYELAYHKISKLVDEKHGPFPLNNCCLWIRDGLPLIQFHTDGEVYGFKLKFRETECEDAYKTISDFLSKGEAGPYEWDVIELKNEESDDPIKINVLIGQELGKGSIKTGLPEWSAKEDPTFTKAMDKIKSKIKDFAEIKFDEDSFEWVRFFELEMAYLLLWTAIERYCSFAYGPFVDPTKKIRTLSYGDPFRSALKEVLNQSERVKKIPELYDSRYLDRWRKLDAEQPVYSIEYYYLVRSNLVHRGKSEWVDGEIIRLSLKELFEIFQTVLEKTLFSQ